MSFSFGVYDGKECKVVKRDMVSEICQNTSMKYLMPAGLHVHMQFCVIKMAGSLYLYHPYQL